MPPKVLEGSIGVQARVSDEARASEAAERRLTFERLTDRRLDLAYRLAAAILGDRDEAQDAVHDAAEQAWKAWPQLRDPSRFDAWFDSIVVNRCRDRLRGRRVRRLASDAIPELSAPDATGTSAEREALAAALRVLGPEHRLVVVLRYVADLTVPEIAARTGCREGTVKSRLHYALRELRAAYDAGGRATGRAR